MLTKSLAAFGLLIACTGKQECRAIDSGQVVDFGIVAAGATAERLYQLPSGRENDRISLADDREGAFAVVDITSNSARVVKVGFSPRHRGPHGAFLVADDGGCADRIALSGVGDEPRIEFPSMVDFGSVALFRERRIRIPFVSRQYFPLRVVGVPQVVDGFEAFRVDSFDDADGGSVAAGAELAVEVGFSPITSGPYKGNMEFVVDVAGVAETLSVELEGIGGAPQVYVTPDRIDLGMVPWVSSSFPLEVDAVVRVASVGQSPLRFGAVDGGVASVAAETLNSSDSEFELVDLPPRGAHLSPGQLTAFKVRVLAATPGPKSAIVSLYTNAFDFSVVQLRVEADAFQLAPCLFGYVGSVDFGATDGGLSVQDVDFVNMTPAVTCFLYGIEVVSDDGVFSVADGGQNRIVAGGSTAAVRLMFDPSRTQRRGRFYGVLKFHQPFPTLSVVEIPISATLN